MREEIPKYLQTISISISNLLAYKINFFLQMVCPALIFFFIQFNLWSAIYQFRAEGSIAGYSFDQLIEYQGWVLIVTLLSRTYNSRNLAEDIRLGRISSFLLYPFDFWQFHLAGFFGFQIVQTFIAFITAVTLYSLDIFQSFSFTTVLAGTSFALLAGLFWYFVQYALGLVAFWLDETWTLRVVFFIAAGFFSGAVIPLEFFPEWAQTIALYLPFPYMTYIPIKFFTGEAPISFPSATAILAIWIFIAWGIGQMIWNKGIRLYSAAGM